MIDVTSKKKYIDLLLCLLLTAIGGIFLLWYIRAAGADVVYSDYIRIVEEYLPDALDPQKLFVPDILTRIPATFLQRFINVELFSYSVTFDRVCSALGITGCALMTALYMHKERMSALWFIPVAAVIFSLNKWEIILNGTAWAHTVAFALFFLNYLLLDSYRQRGTCDEMAGLSEDKGRHGQIWLRAWLCIMPFVILLFSGEYIASYAAVMVAAYVFCMLEQRDRTYIRGLVCTLAALGLYLLSRHFAVWEHAGATDMSLMEVVAEDPLFIPRLFIKSFAGAVLGQQAMADFYGPAMPLSDSWVLLIGVLVIGAYIFAIALYIRHSLWKRSIYPMILMLSGGFNHVLVTASRWIFLNDDYGLSSRYGAQFMIGIIGILLTFALYFKVRDKEKKRCGALMMILTVLIFAGSILTTRAELAIVPYREQNYEALRQAVLDYRSYEPEELAGLLEWGKSEDTMYRALEILEDNRLNVFSGLD